MILSNGTCKLLFFIIMVIGCQIDTTNQLVQMNIKELKKEYPELMNFLYNTSNDRPFSRNKKPRSQYTSKPYPTTKSTSLADNPNSFIYYNATTKMLEGISMQSTYSIFKLNPYKIFTVITTTSFPLYTPASKTSQRRILTHGSASLIPLYHQFIYSIDLFNYLPSERKIDDLANLLNEQTAHASQVRVHILKTISQQLNIRPTSLRINWIEKLNKNENVTTAQLPYEKILISLSNTKLLDLQNSYSAMLSENEATKGNEIAVKYENECTKYFSYLSRIHHEKEFSFDINFLQVIYPNETFFNTNNKQNQDYEHVEKVQLLKLCNIKSIYSILSLTNEKSDSTLNMNRLFPKQLKLANTLIKGSTEEIQFQTEPIVPDQNQNIGNISQMNDYTNEYDEYYSQVISFKSESFQNITNNTNSSSDIVVINNEIGDNNDNMNQNNDNETNSWYIEYTNKAKSIFWSIIPEEDILLAVIVPLTVIVSLIIFSIVTVCLLQMCNKDYLETNKAKKITSLSNTTDLSTLEKPNHNHTKGAIYKERAYLSKGVPVILYEEMSDKPIDDYDENNRDIMDINGCETINRNYRSPLIMRNEKPPVPAPPEYSRDTLKKNSFQDYNLNLNEESHIVVNEMSEESTMLIMNKIKKKQNNTTNNSCKDKKERSPSYERVNKALDSINEKSINNQKIK